MPEIFVAFGVTGDLMRQKILPELFLLHKNAELPENFTIIGVSRKDWSDTQLREYVANIVGQDESFLNRLKFVQGDVNEKEVFEKLSETIGEREAILYIALIPLLYKRAFENLVASPLAKNPEKLRLMIEKPFGTSGIEANELNEILHRAFSESQIYRVDHYLAKESLADIPPLSLENLKEIRITFLQKEGVEKRGAFFDATGATRDLGQNHMMQMFAAMSGGLTSGHSEVKPPERTQIIGDLRALSPEEVATKTSRAQWSGYRDIAGVAPNSQIETYFKIESSWRDIPVIFEGGKYMQEDRKEILLTYEDGKILRFPIENNKNKKEHQMLIMACMRGDHAPFMSAEEIAAQWRFIDPILDVWKSGKPPLQSYE